MTQNNSAEGLLTETEVSKQLRVSLARCGSGRVAKAGTHSSRSDAGR